MFFSLRGYAIMLTCVAALGLTAPAVADPLADAIAAPHRTSEYVERDRYRNPEQTLRFFDVLPEHDVVEISPGAGWYTEILAAYIEGDYYAAHFPPDSDVAYYARAREVFQERLNAHPEVYEGVRMAVFDPGSGELSLPDESVDRVLIFRNIHSLLRANSEEAAFAEMFRVLRPGGLVGVVQHRSRQAIDRERMEKTGYIPQETVIGLAQAAGLEFVAASEVNANLRDNTNHPEGVWTLPPSLRLGDRGRDRYLAIGESDRMTLKFRKPQSDNE